MQYVADDVSVNIQREGCVGMLQNTGKGLGIPPLARYEWRRRGVNQGT